MNLSNLLLTICLALVGHSNAEYTRSLKGMQRLTILCKTPEQQLFIKSFIDDPDVDFLKLTRIISEPIDVLVTVDKLSEFKNALIKRNIEFIVTVEDVEQAVLEEKISNDFARDKATITREKHPYTYYPRYDDMIFYLKAVASKSNNTVTLEEFGRTYENRTLYVVKISSGGNNNKPKILIDAGIHAREWIAPVTALYAVYQLAINESNAYLYENVDWYIIPSLNPDGYEYTHTTYRFWRKTRSENAGSTCYGTDANRNFELQWMTVGASQSPCSEIYAGYKPFSEVETLAFSKFVMANKGAFQVYLTIHSYGQYMLHPWGYTSKLPENEPELRSVGVKAASALAAKFGTKYTVGSSTNVLYAAAGGSDDWVMGVAGADLSYTIELPGGKFDPPPSQIEPVGIETFEAFKVFHEYVEQKYGKSH